MPCRPVLGCACALPVPDLCFSLCLNCAFDCPNFVFGCLMCIFVVVVVVYAWFIWALCVATGISSVRFRL